MYINTTNSPYILFLDKSQLAAIELSLRDSITQHQEYDLYGHHTVNNMNDVLAEVHALLES